MYDSQEHVFTSEFDELCIVISLDMGITSANMRVTISGLPTFARNGNNGDKIDD